MAEDKVKYLEELRDKLEKSNIREFKNWTEVCELFSWKITRGTYKEAREKELSQICNWTKEGHRIIINKINYNNIEIIEKRGKSEGSRNNNTVKYTEDLKLAILSLLVKDAVDNNTYNVVREGIHIYGRMYLYTAIGLTNINYKFASKHQKDYAEFREISLDAVNDFFTSTNNTLSRNLEKAIKSLESMKLVDCTRDMIMISFNEDKLDENGNPIYITKTIVDSDGEEYEIEYKEQISTKPIVATEQQRLKILRIQHEEMIALGCENEWEIVYRSLYKIWKRNFTKRIRQVEGLENFKYCYKSFEFIFDFKNIAVYLNKLGYSTDDCIVYCDNINKQFQESLIKNATSRKKRTINNEKDIVHSYRKKDNFLLDIGTTVNDVVDLNADDIRHKIK